MSRIVSNASPLIVLAKAGLLDLLPKLFSEIVIPQAVGDDSSQARRQPSRFVRGNTVSWTTSAGISSRTGTGGTGGLAGGGDVDDDGWAADLLESA